MATNNSTRIYWRLTSDKPIAGSRVIAETLDGEYIEEQISDEVFDIWDESIIRWAYSPSWVNEHFSKQMNPPKEDKKEEKNDKKLREDIMDAMLYGSLVWFLLSGDSDSNAKCRECCCDGLDDSQDDKMDGDRPRFFNYFKENENKRAGNEKDSSKSESVSDHNPYTPEMYKKYTKLRNTFFYYHANGKSYTRRDAIKRVLECAPELEEVARDLDSWYFID